MLETLYCSVCSNELVSSGHEMYSQEEYYVCPNCDSEYTVVPTEDDSITIQVNVDKMYI